MECDDSKKNCSLIDDKTFNTSSNIKQLKCSGWENLKKYSEGSYIFQKKFQNKLTFQEFVTFKQIQAKDNICMVYFRYFENTDITLKFIAQLENGSEVLINAKRPDYERKHQLIIDLHSFKGLNVTINMFVQSSQSAFCPAISKISFFECEQEFLSKISIVNAVINMENSNDNAIELRNNDINLKTLFNIKNLIVRYDSSGKRLFFHQGYSAFHTFQYLNIQNSVFDEVFSFNVTKVVPNCRNVIILKNNFFRNSTFTVFLYLNNSEEKNLISTEIKRNHIEENSVRNVMLKLRNNILNFTENFILKNKLTFGLLNFNDKISEAEIHRNIFKDNFVDVNDFGLFSLNILKVFRMKQNIFINNLKYFFIYSQIKNSKSNSLVDITKNYWDVIHANIQEFIYDGRSNLDLKILEIEPRFTVFPIDSINKKCGLSAWRYFAPNCYFFHSGPMLLNDANQFCQKFSSALLNNAELTSNPQISNIFESDTNHDFWTKESLSQQNNDLNEFRPFICVIKKRNICKNDCSGNGICIGNSCVCGKGWQGNDCSSFHCSEVGNCYERGQCVGPNICKCNIGWIGRSCSESPCPRYSQCRQCTKRRGCGWCDSMQRCLPGNAQKSYRECPSWFYHNCFSVAPSVCSTQVKIMDCNFSHCHSSNFNYGNCEQCRDLEKCYKDTSDGCKIWNEKSCPNGIIQFSTQFNRNVILKKNVINLKKHIKIFKCKSQKTFKYENELDIFIVKNLNDSMDLQENSIIVSNEMSNVRHRIIKFKNKNYENTYNTFIAKPVWLNEFLEYASFQSSLMFNYKENYEKSEEFQSFYKTKQEFKSLENTKHFRCHGNEYFYLNKVVQSFYVIIKENIEISKGNVVVGEKNTFCLEKFASKEDNGIDTFIETKPFYCSNEQVMKNVELDKIKILNADIECNNGNENSQVYSIDSSNFKKNLYGEETVSLRQCPTVLGFVLNVDNLKNNWKMLELVNLKSISINLNVSGVGNEDFVLKTTSRDEEMKVKVKNNISKSLMNKLIYSLWPLSTTIVFSFRINRKIQR